MVNPLFLLPLLTASTLNTTANGCYEPAPPGQPEAVSTTYFVCTQAINTMTAHRILDAPVVFGHSVKVGHKLPDRFVHSGLYSSCIIDIDIADGRQDTMTWRDIVVAASMLRDECVAPPPHLGGEGKAGPGRLMSVRMYGRDKEGGVVLPVGSSRLVVGEAFDA